LINIDSSNIIKIDLQEDNSSIKLLKKGIWLYFLLLIFEGALRKWFLPFLSGPLTLIRDPLAFFILVIAIKNGILKFNFYLGITVLVSVLGISTTLVFGHGNLGITLFGSRIMLLHFPLIFVIGNIFNESDVLKIGKVLLYISIPMTILMIIQFYSPQSALVNRGVGGDVGGGGFNGGAFGFFRPPGTFSFITGLTQFYGLLLCFVLYFWYKPSGINFFIRLAATVGAFCAIPFSLSRSLFFQTLVSLLFFMFVVSMKPKNLIKVLFGVLGASVILVLLSNLSIFKTPIEAFMFRFEGANKYEGGVESVLVDRYLGSMFSSVGDSNDASFFGHGLGIGTNAGSQLLSKFSGGNNWVENEWSRIFFESGIFLGFIIIGIRLALAFSFFSFSYKLIFKDNTLPWLLLSFCSLILVNGQWGQPTSLGFAVFSAGILLAVLNQYNKNFKESGNKNLK
tara:strand:+ start:19354 stop:20712 length:1359 start_codon:yes stop_codon:yes gene_type:complete